MPKGIRVATKPECIDRIYRSFAEVNETTVVYHRKCITDKIENKTGPDGSITLHQYRK